LFTQKIPDSTFIKIHSKPTVKNWWDLIIKEYTTKEAYVQTNLCMQFLDMKYKDFENIWTFLEKLVIKWEELSTIGIKKDYRSVINFIWPYLYQFFNDSHSLNNYEKPLKIPFD